jgi:hypothetical protein
MYTTLNKQTSFFVALSLILVLFSTCKKGSNKYKSSNTPTIEWQKTISNNDTTIINSTQQSTDGSYILAGHKINGLNSFDYWIVKLKKNTDIEWEKTYGGSNADIAKSIQQTTDRGYIVAGSSDSNDGNVTNNKGYTDAWILKLSTNGDVEWQKTYGGNADDYLSSIKQTTDGGYIAVGHSNSSNSDITSGPSDYDAWIIKIDTNGNLEWTKTLGGSSSDYLKDIQQTTNGEYLIAGHTISNNGDITNSHGSGDWWVIKLQANGSLAWQKTYGGSSNDYANCIQKTNDGHYVIAGSTFSSDGDITTLHGDKDAWVVKVDDLGNILQQTTVGTNDSEEAVSILKIYNNNFLITGYSSIINSSNTNAFIATLGTNCNLLWQRQIPQGVNNSYAKAIFETPDCSYMLFGNQFFDSFLGNNIIIKLK